MRATQEESRNFIGSWVPRGSICSKPRKGPAIYCLAVPQIMARHPFSQGLANCAALAKIVAEDVSASAFAYAFQTMAAE